jgi:hypothetical protein
VLISQEAYFGELVEASPLMSALQPSSGLLGKEYTKDVDAESDHHLHVRGIKDSLEGLWRISLESVDGWVIRAAAETETGGHADKGPFARLLSA